MASMKVKNQIAEAVERREENPTSRARLIAEIEKQICEQSRSTTADEVDRWLRETRERPV